MTSKTLKALSVGLGGLAAVFLPCGQARAQTACGAEMTVASIEATPGFSCTFGNKTLSGFSFGPQIPGDMLVEVGIHGSDYTVTLGRDGTFFPSGNIPALMDYTIAMAPGDLGMTMWSASTGVDVSVASDTTTTTLMGDKSGSATLGPITNGGTALMTLSAGDMSIMVTNSITGSGQLNSITNDFSEEKSVVGVPEPAAFGLLALGLAGLGFGSWRSGRRNAAGA